MLSSAAPSPWQRSRAEPRAANRSGRLQKENAMDVNLLLESLRESLHPIGAFLPRLLVATVSLGIGWLAAKAVRFTIVRALGAINFNVVTQKAGIDHFLKQGGAQIGTIRVLAALFYWLVILAALMISSNSLDLAYVTVLI